MISVIIPVYNEEVALRKNKAYFKDLGQQTDLIFVDGGSLDQTAVLAAEYGKVLRSPKLRALQMNLGAQSASSEVLLFLHADTVLPLHQLDQIQEAVHVQKAVAGCFTQVLDRPEWIYRYIAWTGNLRARISKIFYGDQGIFVRKDVFNKLGGFPEVSLAEDVRLTTRLRKEGRTVVLKAPIYCSARRWIGQGVWKTFWLNMRINWMLMIGKDITALADFYTDIREDVLFQKE
jgi:rSAM/selenodomain-associated transferase 2